MTTHVMKSKRNRKYTYVRFSTMRQNIMFPTRQMVRQSAWILLMLSAMSTYWWCVVGSSGLQDVVMNHASQ